MTEGGDGGLAPGSEGAMKISIALKGRPKPPRTDEHCRNLARAFTGKKLLPETIEKRSETIRRKHAEGYARPPMSEEAKQKISDANRNRVHTPEEKAHRAAAAVGKKHSEEWRKNISEALKKRHYVHPPEVIEKIAASRRGTKHSPETIAKMSATHTGKKKTPEHIANAAKALRASLEAKKKQSEQSEN